MRMNGLARRARERRAGVMVGCLVVVGVVVVILVIAAIYAGMHWRGWAASGVSVVTEKVVAESGLPKDQKDQILAEVHGLGEDFKAGKIGLAEMQKVMEEIAGSPLIPLAAV